MMHKLWFKAKHYGWGWYPATWQGWTVMGVYIAMLIIFLIRIENYSHSGSDTLIGMIVPFIVLTALLITICYRTGEKPRWRWGSKE